MKKILHLAPYYAPHLGGVETHLKEINRLLVAKKHQVTVICFQSDESEKLEETIVGVRVIRIPVNDLVPAFLQFSPLKKLYVKIKVWTWVAQHNKLFLDADVIQVHDVMWWIWPLYMVVYYKVYLTFHGWEGRYPVRQRDKIHRLFNSWGAKKTIHVGDFISQFYLDKPSYVIYGGTNTPSLSQNNDSGVRELISNSTQIVFLGRLEKENDIEKYLSLFSLLKKSYPKLQITFVGDGMYKEACAKVGVVTGWVKNPQTYLKKADVVCASSYLSILEAQSYGKLVISFYSHPLKKSYLETFPGAPYMIIGSDPKLVSKKIEKWETIDLKKLHKKIRAFAQTMSWEKVVAVYEKMWSGE
jgi:glycosyltransferase involved in cell wall biosynthesis